MPTELNQKLSLRIAILEQLQTLVIAGFGLVAALAWNTAIQDLFRLFLPDQQSLAAKFLYAVFITIVVVLLTNRLSKTIEALKTKVK